VSGDGWPTGPALMQFIVERRGYGESCLSPEQPAARVNPKDESRRAAASHVYGRPYAALRRLLILAIVARLQPVAACMELQDWPVLIMRPMPSLRSASSARPL
jgi:hypothetical protein